VAEVFCETYRIYYTRPQTRELWLQGHLTPGAIDADQQTNLYLAGQLEIALRNLAANSEALELHHCAVAIETMDYLLRFALRHEPLGDPLLVGEAMVAVASYLSNYVRQPV
jgi:Tetracyclin repressor-like, C-terminal domain